MTPVFYDLETFWSAHHSLTKINPIVYVMHPDTELQTVSYAIGDGPIHHVLGEAAVTRALQSIDWSDKMAVAHNGSGFDHLILAWRLGIRPKAYGCTQAMARPFYGLTCGVGAGVLATELKINAKGSLGTVGTKGLRVADFTPDMVRRMREYNNIDVYLCREFFNVLAPKLGRKELQMIDAIIRMTVDARFEADFDLLNFALKEEKAKKRKALLELAAIAETQVDSSMSDDDIANAMRSVVMSQPQFALLLERLGVEVPLKPSPRAKDENGVPKLIPALAKKDKGMTDLLEYEDPSDEEKSRKVQVAAGTRLEVKTTQLETRLQTFIDVGNACGGKLPIPLNYCGAVITWRMSGSMKMNGQNLVRIDPDEYKTSDALRKSLRAPKGKKIVVCDSSNIELRVAHMLAGQHDTIDMLREGEDLYCWFASNLYGRTITKADKPERFIGKVAMLSLQYGSSWRTFKEMVRVMSGGKRLLSDSECENIVFKWRSMFKAISGQRGIWNKCGDAILAMVAGRRMEIGSDGLLITGKERIDTPDNHWLQYPSLHQELNKESGRQEWIYGQGYRRSRIYPAMLFENICQHLARLIVMEQTMAVHSRYPVALSCHDEGVFVVDEASAQDCKEFALQCFSTPPAWWPEIPLAAEADIGDTYGAAK